MQKGKFSWQTFLITILVIIVLGCLVYYLEQNRVLEGFEGKNKNKHVAHDKDGPPPSAYKETEASAAKTNGNGKTKGNPKPVSDLGAKKQNKNSKKEGFTNMLSYAPIDSQGADPGCVDPLKPYAKYKCGPIDVNNFFGDIQFKPECCGNPAGSSTSNSMGCACMCPEQWRYLNSRGGNRTFPSEF